MASIITSKYHKQGAMFATAQDAFADKNSLFPAELKAAIAANYSTLLISSVLLEGPSHTWEPDTYILSVTKRVANTRDFYQGRTFNSTDILDLAEQAGWTFLGDTVTTI